MLNCSHDIVSEPRKKLSQSEKYLYKIWLEKTFKQEHLKTLSGTAVSILNPGTRNESAGPDFNNAMIMLGDDLVSGDIEIHIRNNDWYLHGHEQDENYNNVVLHVIKEPNDEQFIKNFHNENIEILVVEPIVATLDKQLFQCKNWEPINFDNFKFVIEEYASKRFQRKTLETRKALMQYQPEQYFFIGLLDMLGYSKNREAMKKIAGNLDIEDLYSIISEVSETDRLLVLEIILLGVSGMLTNDYKKYFGNDHYFESLQIKWKSVSKKYNLTSILGEKFHFAGVRPVNYPHKRLVALAQIINNIYPQKPAQFCLNTLFSGRKFELMLEILKDKFQMPSGMWKNHPLFKSHTSHQLIGNSRLMDFISNIMLPFARALSSILKNEQNSEYCIEINKQVPIGAIPGKIDGFLKNLTIAPKEIKSNYLLQGCIEYHRLFCNLELCNICRFSLELVK